MITILLCPLFTAEIMARKAGDVRRLLSRCDTRHNGYMTLRPPGYVPASVLLPLFYRDDTWHVLLTVRSKHLSSHKGLVAFPGGHVDDSDTDDVSTALREAEEEIGLPPKDVDVIAVLPQSPVRPNKIVSVVVGVIPADFKPHINEREVDKVFTLPLSRFLQDNYKTQDFTFAGRSVRAFFFTDVIDGAPIVTWGFTAVYCMQVALVVLESDKELVFRDGNSTTRHTVFDPKSSQEYLSSVLTTSESSAKL